MRVLITRPREEAETLAQALAARGIDSLIDPLLEIRTVPTQALSLEGVQALVFTSANGVRAFAAREGRRDLPVFAIGEQTAAVARAAGFARVASADGAVPELVRLVRAQADPKHGALLHGAGAEVRGELAEKLARDGFEVRRIVLYEAVFATALADATVLALRDDSLDSVLLFSPRSAGTFVSLIEAAGLRGSAERLMAMCLSSAVAAAATLPWREIRIARAPNQSAFLELFAGPVSGEGMTEEHGGIPEEERAGVAESPAQRVIRAFGGLRPMASKLDVPVTTVQGWKERGHIPQARVSDVLAAATKHGIPLTAADLEETTLVKAGITAANGLVSSSPPAAAAGPTGASPSSAASTAEGPKAQHESAAQPERVARAPEAQPAPPARRRGTAALWAVAMAVLVFAAAQSLPYWGQLFGIEMPNARPPLPTAESDAALARRLDDVAKTLDTVTARLGSLESQAKTAPAGSGTASAAIAEELAGATRRVAALERLVAELASRPAPRNETEAAKLVMLGDQLTVLKDESAKLAQQLGAQQARLDAMDNTVKKSAQSDERRVGFVLAVTQLHDALARSQPYDKALAAAAALAPNDTATAAALEALRARAPAGVPTSAEIAARFDAVSVAAARAALAPAQPGWIGAALARLSRLVVIRRTDTTADDGIDAILARAEARLKAGDLSGAAAELGTLEGAAANAVKPWLEQAHARLAADAAVGTLTTRAIAALGEKSP
jgi:uroporphyrinogen-III synthase